MFRGIEGRDVVGELAEGFRARVDGIVEGSKGYLLDVAGVDDQHVGRRYDAVPVGRIDVGSDLAVWVYRLAEGHDLLLEAYLHASEGKLFAVGFFDFEVGEPLV